MVINGDSDAYCPYFLIQFKYLTTTDVTPANLRFYFRTPGNNSIEVASIDFFKEYVNSKFIFKAKLCTGVTVDLSALDFTIDNSPYRFSDGGTTIYSGPDLDSNPLPEQNQCL
jgi:hypothetical protein